jgi:hypothetical protein
LRSEKIIAVFASFNLAIPLALASIAALFSGILISDMKNSTSKASITASKPFSFIAEACSIVSVIAIVVLIGRTYTDQTIMAKYFEQEKAEIVSAAALEAVLYRTELCKSPRLEFVPEDFCENLKSFTVAKNKFNIHRALEQLHSLELTYQNKTLNTAFMALSNLKDTQIALATFKSWDDTVKSVKLGDYTFLILFLFVTALGVAMKTSRAFVSWIKP